MELTVKGFKAAAVKAGIRGKDRLDLGMIYSEVPAAGAAVFTTSSVKAAPVVLGAEKLKSGRAQAIVVNSAIANACTGARGMELARGVAGLAAKTLRISEDLVQVSSTGVIGEQLDLSCFEKNMARLAGELDEDNFMDVARAMMTTDTVEKIALREIEVDGGKIRLLGLAKGAGMIMPNMATMLCFVVTDAAVSADLLGCMLKKGVDQSFNVITVDGDTSTNDTVLVMANGLAGNSPLTGMDQDGAGIFQKALDDLLKDLALRIVADGEGATKLITVRVKGASSVKEAEQAARTVANSALFKTACFGEDANWGRIIAALGRSGVDFDPDRVDIGFDDVLMVREGLGLKENEEQATNVLKKKEFSVNIDIKKGDASSEVYTCDFSLDYVRINADYRT